MTAERHLGKFRGVVTDTDDPKQMGRLRARVPEVLGDVESGWALPHAPYAGDNAGSYMIPPPDSGVWIEFEAGDPSRPIWTGCWWKSGQLPQTEAGSAATPAVKIVRSKEGLQLSMDDDGKTVVVSDSDGSNLLKVESQAGQVSVKASTKVVVTASQVEITEGASHPLVYGDDLLQFLRKFVLKFNTHMHSGQVAPPMGGPVSPMITSSSMDPPAQSLLSTKVKTG
jgi:hypothetical protein